MQTNELRDGIPALPPGMAHLAVDERGFPVPFFVAYVDGKPDHRIIDPAKMGVAVKQNRCWICGRTLGVHKSFLIGPMCAVNRTISEPPSHLECCRYSAVACPFLSRPHMRRREGGMPEEVTPAAGEGIKRNPGVVCIWTTRTFKPFRAYHGNSGVLFRIGEPESMEWIAYGRPATRDEVMASIESGLPLLEESALAEGPRAIAALHGSVRTFIGLLDNKFQMA